MTTLYKYFPVNFSSALDEAAAALTRMRSDPAGASDNTGRSLVAAACSEGDIGRVRRLLDEGRVSVHETTEEGESLLSLACSAGYYELAQVKNYYRVSHKSFCYQLYF